MSLRSCRGSGDRQRLGGHEPLRARVYPRGESLQSAGTKQASIVRAREYNLIDGLEIAATKVGIADVTRNGCSIGHDERDAFLRYRDSG